MLGKQSKNFASVFPESNKPSSALGLPLTGKSLISILGKPIRYEKKRGEINFAALIYLLEREA